MLLSVISAPLHMLVILNFCGFLLFLFAKSVQAFFLGPLRDTEVKVTDVYCCCLSFCFVPITELFVAAQKTQERLLNFTVFKIMFIAAMLEHHLGQLLVWVGWFRYRFAPCVCVFDSLTVQCAQRGGVSEALFAAVS